MLKALDIHKSFGDLTVLKGVDLTIQTGELVSIVGKSGCGKTTLLQILGTLDLPDKGELMLGERDLLKLRPKELAKVRNEKFGFIFQFHYLLNEFTAVENCAMPGFLANKPKKECIQRAKKLLDYMGLSERFEHKPNQMSGGEKQRVAIARALLNEPDLVLADEPTGNLDTQTSEDIKELFLKLNSEFNQSFVIVTHQDDVADMCSRKITMRDGLIIN